MVVYKPRWFIEVNTTVVHRLDMTRADPQMKIRMPPDLHDRIAELAKTNKRSMNAEIIARLQNSIQSDLFTKYSEDAAEGTIKTEADIVAEKIVSRVVARVEDTYRLMREEIRAEFETKYKLK